VWLSVRNYDYGDQGRQSTLGEVRNHRVCKYCAQHACLHWYSRIPFLNRQVCAAGHVPPAVLSLCSIKLKDGIQLTFKVGLTAAFAKPLGGWYANHGLLIMVSEIERHHLRRTTAAASFVGLKHFRVARSCLVCWCLYERQAGQDGQDVRQSLNMRP
jgi:hypothetical protein